ncbi:hypothetical protein [Streptomyces canus]|uniref:hypothetical protein n=1 Tax=Streptomyces canus TaxID=58343 RepID=UPI002F912E96
MSITETVRRLDLDNQDLPVDHGQDEEDDLARMLVTAAWDQVSARTPIGFAFAPLEKAALEDPGAFTFTRLLELPHRDLVTDVTAQLRAARWRLRVPAPGPWAPTTTEILHARLLGCSRWHGSASR